MTGPDIEERAVEDVPDPYALFSVADENPAPQDENPAPQDENQAPQDDNNPGNPDEITECSTSKICTDESTQKKGKVKVLKKRPVPRSVSSSDSESEATELRELKKQFYEYETKMKRRYLKSRNLIYKLKEEKMDQTSKILNLETRLTCQTGNVVTLQLDIHNYQKKIKQLQEEKADLQVTLNAKEASITQFQDYVNDFKEKEEGNRRIKIEYHNLKKEHRRCESKLVTKELLNQRLTRRLTYSRKMNKKAMNMLVELKDISKESLDPKKQRKVHTIIEELKQSLTFEIDE